MYDNKKSKSVNTNDTISISNVEREERMGNGESPAAARPDWDEYYLNICQVVASRADCTRAQHGAVIVDSDHRIVSTGYNGSPSGLPGCLTNNACPRGRLTAEELGHLAGGYDDPSSPGFCISVHAEANAIIYAGRGRTVDGTIYVTGKPCHGCEKLIASAGISRIVYMSTEGEKVEVDSWQA